MHLPKIPDFKPPRALITDSFLGINREQGAKVNEFADAQNLSSREYPCLATAYPPRKIGNASSVLGVCYADALIRVEEGALYYAEERIEDSRITNGEKSLVCAGKRVYIFPDRLCFDCGDMSISDMERSARVDSGLLIITPCLKDYSACPIIQSDIRPEADSPDSLVGSFWLDSSCFPPKLKRYVHSESASDFIEVEPDGVRILVTDSEGNSQGSFYEGFEKGDSLTLSGTGQLSSVLSSLGLSSTFIVHENGTLGPTRYLILDTAASSFANIVLSDPEKTGTFTVTRRVPRLDGAVLCRNRIFGYSLQENRIYASAKDCFGSWYGSNGSQDNAMCFDAGTPAPFTAVTCIGDVPYFFKEDHLHRIIGSTQSVTACTGVKQGCRGSVQILADKLIYASRNQVSIYSSGRAESISQCLGRLDFDSASAALLEDRYYLSLIGGRSGDCLYVYDISRGIWHRESFPAFTHSVRMLSQLYTFGNGEIYLREEGAGASAEEMRQICWYAESSELPVCDGEKKSLSRIVISAELKEGASLDIYVMYDSDGSYVFAGSAAEGVSSLPVLLRRSDRVRVRLEGRGEVKIRSLVRIYTPGSYV